MIEHSILRIEDSQDWVIWASQTFLEFLGGRSGRRAEHRTSSNANVESTLLERRGISGKIHSIAW